MDSPEKMNRRHVIKMSNLLISMDKVIPMVQGSYLKKELYKVRGYLSWIKDSMDKRKISFTNQENNIKLLPFDEIILEDMTNISQDNLEE